jgi:hypothetical protein
MAANGRRLALLDLNFGRLVTDDLGQPVYAIPLQAAA